MKAKYRGFDIESKKEMCLGGWGEVYWSAYRISDGYELACGFGDGTVREMYTVMKILVNRFIDEYKENIEEYEKNEGY
jgi:hypothetical protein